MDENTLSKQDEAVAEVKAELAREGYTLNVTVSDAVLTTGGTLIVRGESAEDPDGRVAIVDADGKFRWAGC